MANGNNPPIIFPSPAKPPQFTIVDPQTGTSLGTFTPRSPYIPNADDPPDRFVIQPGDLPPHVLDQFTGGGGSQQVRIPGLGIGTLNLSGGGGNQQPLPVTPAPANVVWNWLTNKQKRKVKNGKTVHLGRGGNKYAVQPDKITVKGPDGKWRTLGPTPGSANSGGGGGGSGARISGNKIVLPNGRKIKDNKKNRKKHGLPLN